MNIIIKHLSDCRIIKLYNKFQSSAVYPVLFAAVCVFSSVMGNGVYIPCVWVLTCAVVLGLLVNPDTKTFLVPFFLFFTALAPIRYIW